QREGRTAGPAPELGEGDGRRGHRARPMPPSVALGAAGSAGRDGGAAAAAAHELAVDAHQAEQRGAAGVAGLRQDLEHRGLALVHRLALPALGADLQGLRLPLQNLLQVRVHPRMAASAAVVLLVTKDALGAAGADEHVAVDLGLATQRLGAAGGAFDHRRGAEVDDVRRLRHVRSGAGTLDVARAASYARRHRSLLVTLYPRDRRDANTAEREARRGQRDVGAGPGAAVARVGGDGLLRLPLGAERLREAKQRPAVLGVPAQVLAIDGFRLGGAAGGQQDGAERLAHGEIP